MNLCKMIDFAKALKRKCTSDALNKNGSLTWLLKQPQRPPWERTRRSSFAAD